jgi:branched-chain amino acid transport system ATP-binding protein
MKEEKFILQTVGLCKKFAGLNAVSQFDLAVKPRTIHALIGPNGAGKTTTINMIAGALPPTSGDVFFAGEQVTSLQTYEIARKGMARTFQNLKLFSSMSVIENVMVGAHMHSKVGFGEFLLNFGKSRKEEKELREKAKAALERIHMFQYCNSIVKNLPYGQQKMVELGRAIVSEPLLLLLDEPAAGLTPNERSEFVKIMIMLYEEGTDIFLIEHNMDVIMNISNMITVLNFGMKIAEGTPKEIQSHDEVIKAYLGGQYKKI